MQSNEFEKFVCTASLLWENENGESQTTALCVSVFFPFISIFLVLSTIDFVSY